MQNLPPDDAIGLAAAAKIRRVHRSQLVRWIRQGSLNAWRRRDPSAKPGKPGPVGYVVSRAEVEARWERVPSPKAEREEVKRRLREIPTKRESEKGYREAMERMKARGLA